MRTPEVPEQDETPVVVPCRALSAAALRGVVEAFVLREATDYGEREFTFEEKIAQVMRQLENAEAQVVFDPGTGTVGIVAAGTPVRPS